MRRSIALALALAFMLVGQAHAQTAWPAKPIRLIVGFAAGGSTDVTARIIAQALSDRLGQPVVVENRGGAGGNIGADAVAKAEPDGYTLLMATSSTFAANPNLYKSLPFDVRKDFAPIAVTAFIPNLLVVNPSVPANNVADFIAYLKANPDKLNFASAGNGTSQHLSGELFNSLAGVRMTHVAYRGGAPAVSDLLGGQVQVIFARHHHGPAIAAVARSADDPGIAAGLRSGAMEWPACPGQHAARHHRSHQPCHHRGAALAGSKGETRRAGQRAGRQYARGVQGLHRERTRQVAPAGRNIGRDGAVAPVASASRRHIDLPEAFL